MVEALDWEALVREARRRREKEGLTQLGHAELAGVSRDTIRTFDRGEHSISVAKATAILQVVGLISRRVDDAGRHHVDFVRRALERWDQLIAPLPDHDPARFPHGRVVYDYELRGDLRPVQVDGLVRLLADVPSVSSWSPFHVFRKSSLHPVAQGDEEIECWVGRQTDDKIFTDAPHSDYWRASCGGNFVLLRGYREDGDQSHEPGTFLDVRLPIWQIADVVETADLIASHFPGRVRTVAFNITWEGIQGRRLASWLRPTDHLLGRWEHRSRVASIRSGAIYELNGSTPGVIRDVVGKLARPLYAAFNFDDPDDLLSDELERRRIKGRPPAGA